uniref:Uncharacterized protein n=1 Tax=Glossina austeni TaxID=7395 RepID=A0A1A9V780_GLOAU
MLFSDGEASNWFYRRKLDGALHNLDNLLCPQEIQYLRAYKESVVFKTSQHISVHFYKLPSVINVFISVPSYLILTIFLAEISPQYIRPSKQSLSKPMAIEATDIGLTFFAFNGTRTITTPWEIIRKPESCC